MSATGLLIGAALAYLFLARGPAGAPRPAPEPTPAPGGQATPEGTFITLPGIGSYANIYGRGVSITLDPRLFSGLFGGGPPQPEPEYQTGLAGPTLGSYNPEGEPDPPIALYPPTWVPTDAV